MQPLNRQPARTATCRIRTTCPSAWGRQRCRLATRFETGSFQSFTLVYTAGYFGIDDTGSIKMRIASPATWGGRNGAMPRRRSTPRSRHRTRGARGAVRPEAQCSPANGKVGANETRHQNNAGRLSRDRWFESGSLQRRVISEPWAKGTRDADLNLASPLLGPAGDRHNRAQGVVSHGASSRRSPGISWTIAAPICARRSRQHSTACTGT
jgi:hypothetical protein